MTLPKAEVRAPRGTGELKGRGPRFVPKPITSLEDTGLSQLWLQDLALKILYFRGYVTGFDMAEAMALPFAGLIEHVLEALKREQYVEVKKTGRIWRRIFPIRDHRSWN